MEVEQNQLNQYLQQIKQVQNMQQKVFNIKKMLQEKDAQNQTCLSIHTLLENQISNLTNSIINQ